MTGRLDGRVAVVTGAAAGLGRAISLRFAAEGAHVVAADLRANVQATVDEILAAGGLATSAVADLAVTAQADALIAIAAELTGRLDIVVNNAGRYGGSTLAETSDDEFDDYLDVNLRTTFALSRAAVRRMLTQEPVAGVRGRIVNMASQLGITGPPAALSYAVAKGGVIMLTKQAAVDYGPQGIVINAIAPGRILTGDHPGEREYLETGAIDDAMAFSLKRTPFTRMGEPADIAGAALFLASDEATFVSGAVISVDGGWTAY